MKKRRPDLVALDAITDLVLAHGPTTKRPRKRTKKTGKSPAKPRKVKPKARPGG